MSTQPKSFLTPEQYLEIERKAEFKSEYVQGEMFAMAGAGLAHVTIVSNLLGALRDCLRGKGCQVLASDMRVGVSAARLYTYPDIVALCGKPLLSDDTMDTLLNPSLLAEVLSPSTEAYDRGRKFQYYKTIESLREYLLIASDRIHVDLFTRQPSGQWLLTSATSLEESIELQSVDCRIRLVDVYEAVELT